MKPTVKKILTAGVKLWPDVTPSKVAKAMNLKSHVNVLYHFPRGTLKDAVAEYAVETGNSKVIAQLILTGHKAIKDMPVTVRRKHLQATA